MGIIVQKFGGTSVGDVERISSVAERAEAAFREGHQLVVVLSAMAGETDRLLSLASAFATRPQERELDVLLATGEQVTIALLCLALKARGIDAVSYTGWQVPLLTDSAFNKARIIDIDC